MLHSDSQLTYRRLPFKDVEDALEYLSLWNEDIQYNEDKKLYIYNPEGKVILLKTKKEIIEMANDFFHNFEVDIDLKKEILEKRNIKYAEV